MCEGGLQETLTLTIYLSNYGPCQTNQLICQRTERLTVLTCHCVNVWMRLTFDLSTDNALSICCHCHGLFYMSKHIVLLHTKDHCTNVRILNKRNFDNDNALSIDCECNCLLYWSKTHCVAVQKRRLHKRTHAEKKRRWQWQYIVNSMSLSRSVW